MIPRFTALAVLRALESLGHQDTIGTAFSNEELAVWGTPLCQGPPVPNGTGEGKSETQGKDTGGLGAGGTVERSSGEPAAALLGIGAATLNLVPTALGGLG